MGRFGLNIGQTYQSQSPNVDAELCINWYGEIVESQQGKTAMALYPSPGAKIFCTVNEAAILGQKWVPALGRYFIAGKSLWEISSTGLATNRGPLNATPNGPIQMIVNPTQMLIMSGGTLYTLIFSSNTLATAGGYPSSVSQIAYSDGFGIALTANSNTFQLSAINDFTTWPGTSSTNVSLFPDNIVSMIVDHREICLLGNTASTVYSNVGAPIFPFQPIPGAYIEQGCAAAFATVQLDNSVFWLNQDQRGSLVAYRSQGYNGIRISNHAVELAWQSYATTSDAIGYSFQMKGHAFWHLYFPTANVSWRYDVATGMWHNVGYWKTTTGTFDAHHSQNHQFAFGKHLVGDWASGTVFQMEIPTSTGTGGWLFADDNGNPIRRVRRAPHVSIEQQWIFHNQIQVDLETGLGPVPGIAAPSSSPSFVILAAADGTVWQVTVGDDGSLLDFQFSNLTPQYIYLNDPADTTFSWLLTAQPTTGEIIATNVEYLGNYPATFGLATSPSGLQSGLGITHVGTTLGLVTTALPSASVRDPQLMLRWSDDGGHSWSNIYTIDCGQAGQYRKRAIRRRLGRSRDRIYEISATDPIPWRIVDAYLDAEPAFKPTQRMADVLKQRA